MNAVEFQLQTLKFSLKMFWENLQSNSFFFVPLKPIFFQRDCQKKIERRTVDECNQNLGPFPMYVMTAQQMMRFLKLCFGYQWKMLKKSQLILGVFHHTWDGRRLTNTAKRWSVSHVRHDCPTNHERQLLWLSDSPLLPIKCVDLGGRLWEFLTPEHLFEYVCDNLHLPSWTLHQISVAVTKTSDRKREFKRKHQSISRFPTDKRMISVTLKRSFSFSFLSINVAFSSFIGLIQRFDR